MITTMIISIFAILISLASLALSFLTVRRRRQYQRAGDNSVQVQTGRREEGDDWG